MTAKSWNSLLGRDGDEHLSMRGALGIHGLSTHRCQSGDRKGAAAHDDGRLQCLGRVMQRGSFRRSGVLPYLSCETIL